VLSETREVLYWRGMGWDELRISDQVATGTRDPGVRNRYFAIGADSVKGKDPTQRRDGRPKRISQPPRITAPLDGSCSHDRWHCRYEK